MNSKKMNEYWMFLKDITLYLDIFSFNPNLCFDGHYTFRSELGVIMSVIFYIISGILGFTFLLNYIHGDKINVVQSSIYGNENEIPLTGNTVMLRLYDELGNDVPISIIYPVAAMVKEDSISLSFDFIFYNLRKCEKSDFEGITSKNLNGNNNFYCLNISSLSKDGYTSLQSNIHKEYFQYLCIFFTECNNDNPLYSVNCSSAEEIKDYMSNHTITLEFYLPQDYCDHNNKTNPILKSFKDNSQLISDKYTYFQASIKKVFYYSDDGFIFEKLMSYSGLQKQNEEFSYMNKPFYVESLGAIHFNLEMKASFSESIVYKRNYYKIQEVFADFSGIFNVLFVIFKIICYLFTRSLYFREIISIQKKDNYYSDRNTKKLFFYNYCIKNNPYHILNSNKKLSSLTIKKKFRC